MNEDKRLTNECVNIDRKTHMEHQLTVFATLRSTDHTFLPFIENATQVKIIRKILSAKREKNTGRVFAELK